jgi:hypothetical protein
MARTTAITFKSLRQVSRGGQEELIVLQRSCKLSEQQNSASLRKKSLISIKADYLGL